MSARVKALLIAGLVCGAGVALAKPPPPLVPEPLIAACAGKAEGAPCTVKFGNTTKQGQCGKLPDDTLACTRPRKGKH